MRRVLATVVLALTGLVSSLATGQSTQSSPAPADQTQATTPTSQKVIKDPAEYNAYMTALNTQDAAQKAAAMDAFVNQYPNSIVKPEALEQAMASYQAAGNQAKVLETANKILAINPNAVRALAIVTFIDRANANTPEKAAKVRQEAERGLQEMANWTPPSDLSAADGKKMKDQMTVIFAGAAGFGALQAKDYAAAKTAYLKSVQIDPTNLQDVYQLGYASLESNPVDPLGFWYLAKAINLSKGNSEAVKQINVYGQGRYKKYHGGVDGWDQIVAAAATQTAPPADFAIKPAPTPAELACKVVQDNDPATLSASDWEYVLQYRDAGPQCNKDAAEKVWAAIQAKQKDDKGEEVKIKLPGVKVVSSTPETLDVALTEENQAANPPKADIHVIMEKPMTKPPAPGTMTDVIGVFSSYTPNPFMFTMEKGDLPAAAKPKPPVHHPATKKR
jgi:tetratricopeptide (TPR) repeat protein